MVNNFIFNGLKITRKKERKMAGIYA